MLSVCHAGLVREQGRAISSSNEQPNLKPVVKWAKTYQSYTLRQKRIHLHCHSLPAQQGLQLPAGDK